MSSLHSLFFFHSCISYPCEEYRNGTPRIKNTCLPCSPCKYFLPSAHAKAYVTCRRENPLTLGHVAAGRRGGLVETCALLVLLSSPEPIHPAERVKGEERFRYSREQERCWSGARAAAVHSLDNSLAVPSRRPELQRQRPPDCNQPRRGVVFVCFIEKEIKDKG